MHVCIRARVWINRVRWLILLVVSGTGKMNITLFPFASENLVSRDGFGSPVPRQPAHLHTPLNLVLSYEIPPNFRGGVHVYAIGSVPSLSGHAIACRWRSLPRVRRHRAGNSRRSSKRMLPWQVTMDQSICTALSHTHYWYEVGMLKVPARCLCYPGKHVI